MVFTYGGCPANANKFVSRHKCEEVCMAMTHASEVVTNSIPSLVPSTLPNNEVFPAIVTRKPLKPETHMQTIPTVTDLVTAQIKTNKQSSVSILSSKIVLSSTQKLPKLHATKVISQQTTTEIPQRKPKTTAASVINRQRSTELPAAKPELIPGLPPGSTTRVIPRWSLGSTTMVVPFIELVELAFEDGLIL